MPDALSALRDLLSDAPAQRGAAGFRVSLRLSAGASPASGQSTHGGLLPGGGRPGQEAGTQRQAPQAAGAAGSPATGLTGAIGASADAWAVLFTAAPLPTVSGRRTARRLAAGDAAVSADGVLAPGGSSGEPEGGGSDAATGPETTPHSPHAPNRADCRLAACRTSLSACRPGSSTSSWRIWTCVTRAIGCANHAARKRSCLRSPGKASGNRWWASPATRPRSCSMASNGAAALARSTCTWCPLPRGAATRSAAFSSCCGRSGNTP